ncbi:hypothetical protein AGDE_14982 [Angomonas deanei]|nr:hypothetical protein AGDE_14982 [Angomonas deanei]|eukprot:EPY19886.1 hypothetical protein AGDE_14982 [Angomonas deanei]
MECDNSSDTLTEESTGVEARCVRDPTVGELPMSLDNEVVRFLSSLELQGYAREVLGHSEIRTVEALLECVNSEAAAGRVLGPLSVRQQRISLFRGVLRAKKELHTARRKTKKRKLQPGVEGTGKEDSLSYQIEEKRHHYDDCSTTMKVPSGPGDTTAPCCPEGKETISSSELFAPPLVAESWTLLQHPVHESGATDAGADEAQQLVDDLTTVLISKVNLLIEEYNASIRSLGRQSSCTPQYFSGILVKSTETTALRVLDETAPCGGATTAKNKGVPSVSSSSAESEPVFLGGGEACADRSHSEGERSSASASASASSFLPINECAEEDSAGGGTNRALKCQSHEELIAMCGAYGLKGLCFRSEVTAMPCDQVNLLSQPSILSEFSEVNDSHRESVQKYEGGSKLREEWVAEQVLIASTQRKFYETVSPYCLHRSSRFSLLPYEQLKKRDVDVHLGGSISELDPQSTVNQEIRRCILAALMADSIEKLEQACITDLSAGDHPATGGDSVSAFDFILLREGVDVDRVTEVVQKTYPFITNSKVRFFLETSGAPIGTGYKHSPFPSKVYNATIE